MAARALCMVILAGCVGLLIFVLPRPVRGADLLPREKVVGGVGYVVLPADKRVVPVPKKRPKVRARHKDGRRWH